MVQVRYGSEYSQALLPNGTVIELVTREGAVAESDARALIANLATNAGEPVVAVLISGTWIILEAGVSLQHGQFRDAVVQIGWEPDGAAGWDDAE